MSQLQFDYVAPSNQSLETYSKLAPLTASEEMHFDKVNPGVIKAIIRERLESAGDMDAMKKSLFYGKDKPLIELWNRYRERVNTGIEDRIYDQRDAFHGIVGIDTEVAELLELFLNGELTREKVLDEAGDVLWYFNLLLRHFGLTFDQVAAANLAKLAKRFPEGTFSLERWNGRDKELEQKEIEKQL